MAASRSSESLPFVGACSCASALALVIAFALGASAASPDNHTATDGAAPTAWTPELALDVKNISNVQPSPDGARVLFEVATVRTEGEKSDRLTHVWLAASDGSSTIQLTRGDESCSGARWSPDGEWIAFTSSRGGEKTNLFRIRTAGGEAEKLTDVKTGISGYAWSPDGSRIALLMTDEPTEDEEKDKKEKRDARVVDEDLKRTHIHLLPVAADNDGKREMKRLTKGDRHVAGGFFGSPLDWSPDGSRIVYSHTATPKIDDWPTSDLSIVAVDSGEVTTLAATTAAETSPVFSPDGTKIAFGRSDDPPSWAFAAHVCVVDSRGGEPMALVKTFDEQPTILGFAPDGDWVIVAESHRTRTAVYKVPIRARSMPIPVCEPSPFGSMVMNRGATHLGFTLESPSAPPEPFVSSLESYRPARVATVQTVPDLPIGRTEVIQWKSADGREIEGLLTYPVGHRSPARAPMLVIIHGGPAGVFRERFIGTRGAYPIAAFAADGYAVLRCNPRGSAGYGKDFRYANQSDWGGGDYRDIMTGVDHVVSIGVADPDRLGVMGWSYGGFMTSWVITQTDRFKAASVGAGVTNLMSFTGTADIPSFIPDYFGGEYWDAAEHWQSHSAMFQVKGVKTPTLIQHGEQDLRVPVSQGYELYNALKRQGVPTKMVVYPRQPHGIIEPKLQLDAMKRNIEWFDRWVKGGSQG